MDLADAESLSFRVEWLMWWLLHRGNGYAVFTPGQEELGHGDVKNKGTAKKYEAIFWQF